MHLAAKTFVSRLAVTGVTIGLALVFCGPAVADRGPVIPLQWHEVARPATIVAHGQEVLITNAVSGASEIENTVTGAVTPVEFPTNCGAAVGFTASVIIASCGLPGPPTMIFNRQTGAAVGADIVGTPEIVGSHWAQYNTVDAPVHGNFEVKYLNLGTGAITEGRSLPLGPDYADLDDTNIAQPVCKPLALFRSRSKTVLSFAGRVGVFTNNSQSDYVHLQRCGSSEQRTFTVGGGFARNRRILVWSAAAGQILGAFIGRRAHFALQTPSEIMRYATSLALTKNEIFVSVSDQSVWGARLPAKLGG